MRGRGRAEGIRQGGDPHDLGDAASAADIRLQHVERTGHEELESAVPVRQGVECEGHGAALGETAVTIEILRCDGHLEEADIEIGEVGGDLERLGEVVLPGGVGEHPAVRTEHIADDGDGLDVRGDVDADGELDRGESLSLELLRLLAHRALALVALGGRDSGGVDRNLATECASQERVHRLAERAAPGVPEGDVHAGDRLEPEPGVVAAHAHPGVHSLPGHGDLVEARAEDEGGQELVDERSGDGGPHRSLALPPADDTAFGLQPHEHRVDGRRIDVAPSRRCGVAAGAHALVGASGLRAPIGLAVRQRSANRERLDRDDFHQNFLPSMSARSSGPCPQGKTPLSRTR